jgi:3-hydroxybutyryl-CoA dehydratase
MPLTLGQTASRSLRITENMLHEYAALTGDVNPLHFDDDFARRTRFGDRIAHGELTTGLLSALVGTELPGPGAAFLGQNYRFTNPVYVGDEITATVTVKTIKPDKPIVEMTARVTRSDGATVLEGELWLYLAVPTEP